MHVICTPCVNFIRHIQIGTHCVPICPGPIKKEGKFPLLSVTPLHCFQKQSIQCGGALKCHVKVSGVTEQANVAVLCTGASTVVASDATRTGKIPVATNFFTTANV